MLRLSIILLLATTAMAQVPGFGNCPKVEYMTDFDAERYMGVWYEIERYFTIWEIGGKCVQANYTMYDNGTIGVHNKQISYITGIANSISGFARFEDKPNEARLLVTFPSIPFSEDARYWVLDTDYDNYAVVWSCTNYGFISTKYVWILARSPLPMLETMEKAYRILDSNNISRAYFIRTNQKNCPEEF